MTKKDYQKIAMVFQDTKPIEHPKYPEYERGAREQWEWFRDKMAGLLRADNPRFDRDRFLRACEPGANVRAK